MNKEMTFIKREEKEPLILEPEDWVGEWKTILKLFGMKEAERIVIRDYKFEAYGVEGCKEPKWILHRASDNKNDHRYYWCSYECSECGRMTSEPSPYCGECGTRLINR